VEEDAEEDDVLDRDELAEGVWESTNVEADCEDVAVGRLEHTDIVDSEEPHEEETDAEQREEREEDEREEAEGEGKESKEEENEGEKEEEKEQDKEEEATEDAGGARWRNKCKTPRVNPDTGMR
jgi:hypothetical protein